MGRTKARSSLHTAPRPHSTTRACHPADKQSRMCPRTGLISLPCRVPHNLGGETTRRGPHMGRTGTRSGQKQEESLIVIQDRRLAKTKTNFPRARKPNCAR